MKIYNNYLRHNNLIYNHIKYSKLYGEFYQRIMPSAKMFMLEKNLDLNLLPNTIKYVTKEFVQDFYEKYSISNNKITSEKINDNNKIMSEKNDNVSKNNSISVSDSMIKSKSNSNLNSVNQSNLHLHLHDQCYMYKKVKIDTFLKEYNLKVNDKLLDDKLRSLLERSIQNNFNKLNLDKIKPVICNKTQENSNSFDGKGK